MLTLVDLMDFFVQFVQKIFAWFSTAKISADASLLGVFIVFCIIVFLIDNFVARG